MNRPTILASYVMIMLFTVACSSTDQASSVSDDERAIGQRPNIVLIIADDMGFTDIGPYGSEIRTPNLDALADNGILFTRFFANASCTPSRAMLLTGRDNHSVGFGANPGVSKRVPQLQGNPGYTGEFREGTQTLAKILKDNGYQTFMSGKWHLGKDTSSFPIAQGYDRAFFLKHGGSSHFEDMTGNLSNERIASYWEDETPLDRLPEGFYSTIGFTDRAIEFVEGRDDEGAPFFLHLAYTAPHWPLQVPEDWLDSYAGVYDQGWRQTRAKRLRKLSEFGIVDAADEVAAPFPEALPEWEQLTPDEANQEARRMEIYAAMISLLDQEIGRLVDYLDEQGELENTIIVFLSDNGPEGNDVLQLAENATWVPEAFDLSLENMGRSGSYTTLGRGWAVVSAGPSREYKTYLANGGTRVPAIISYPKSLPSGMRFDQSSSIMDIAPTLIELADVDPANGMHGISLVPAIKGEVDPRRNDRDFAMEIYGNRAVWSGDWKLLWDWDREEWTLFDLSSDPAELDDLATAHPDIKNRLVSVWEGFVAENQIHVLDRDYGYGRYADQRNEDQQR